MRIRTFLLLLVILFVLVFSPTNRKQEVMAAQSFFMNDIGLGFEISSPFEIITNTPATLQSVTVISIHSVPFDPSTKVEIAAERIPTGFSYTEWFKRQVDIPTLYGMQIYHQGKRVVDGQEAAFRVISSSQYEIWETRLVVNDIVYTIAAHHNAETEQLYNAVLKGLRFTDGNVQPPNTSLLFNISSSKAISSFPDLKFPYSGTEQITCAYHQNDPNCHPDSLWALDFGLNYETVRAANTGTATSHYDSCVGNYLKIVDQQDSSYFTLYGHLSSITRTGFVVQGADVAISGATGSCQTGPHLHFLLNHNGANIRPEPMCGESGFLRYQWHSDCWNDTFTNPSFESGQVTPWQWVGSCNRAVYQNSQIAHHGSYYLATNRNNNANCTSFFQDIIQAPVPGNTYRLAVWVRSATGTNRQGRVAIWALGGQQENHDTPFSINGTGWQCVETALSVQNSGHYAVRTEVYLDSLDSIDYYFDDMHYQQNGGLLCPPAPTATPQPTNTPVPTNTPRPPTATPHPTATSIPTNTPLPTATLTPFPSPTSTATATPIHTATPTSTATPTPTITPVPTSTPTPEPMVWDDVSCTVQYDNWYGVIDNPFLGGCARATSTGNQWLAYRTSQATTALGMVTYLGPDQGKAWVMIDGQLKGILDLYSPAPTYQIHQVYTNLPQTQHSIIIGATGQKNPASTGVEVRVDGFVVNGQTLDETAAGVILRTWNSAVLSWAYGGSVHLTTQASAAISFEVVGVQFTWITLLCPTCGEATILIDNVPFTTIDTYNPTWQFQHEQVITGLPPGVHMVQIRAQEISSLVFFDGYKVP